MRKVFLLIIISALFMPSVLTQTASDLDTSIEDRNGNQNEFVLGRPITSTFDYTINDPYQPIDTALSIDESGSMGGVMADAKDGAKQYVDNTNTAQGDKNAVISFESSAYTKQSLTSSKSDAKDAIDSISDGGGTDLPSGVSEAHDELNTGSNEVQVMIVLADGGGGDPGTEADAARSDGIKVHGIMYGSGASTSEFESLTDASDCSTDSSENGDGDNCWYAESGTIDDVYQAIQQQVEEETDVSLRMRLNDMAYSDDFYDNYNGLAGSNEEYIRNYYDVSSGSKTRTFEWRPTNYGSYDLLTGDSIIEVTTEDGTTQYDFTNVFSDNVDHVDFEVEDYTVDRDDSQVGVEAKIVNNGDTSSLGPSETANPREFWVKDSSNHVSKQIPSIPAGGSENITMSIGNSNPVVDGTNIEALHLHADANGYWDGLGGQTEVGDAEGEALEPNEDDNLVQVGYPPRVGNIQFNDIPGEHAFSVEATVDILTDGSDFGECRLKFTNQENGEEFPDSGEVEGDLSEQDSDTAKCTYDNFNSSVSGFEPTDNVKVNITAEDDEGATGWGTNTHEIINRAPQITVLGPKNKEPIWERDAILEIGVSDPEGDPITKVEFRDAVTKSIIDSRPSPPTQPQYSAEWKDLDLGTYEWDVEVWDKWDSQLRGPSEFERVVSQIYRVQHTVDHKYSSIIVEEGGQTPFFFESSVATNNRTVTTYLEGDGINVSYADGSTEKTYEVDTGNPERFQVQIEGDQVGENELRIITEDESVTTNTTTKFPVYVRKSVSEGQSIPGLTTIYLVVIGFFSSLLYFVSL